jgi:cytochrome P450
MARATEDLEKTLDHVDLAGDINRFVATRPEFKPQWAATITLHIISAGFDTLGMTLSSCIFWVSKTPGCQVKLLAELDKLRKDGETDDVPTYDQAVSLPYFQACITEAMRLTPVIGISLPRTVPSEGVDIGGYHLSPGDVVGMNPWIVHRNKELFGEDAEAFRPERYIEASESHRHAMESMSLSFGGPSRSCPGRYLAWLALSKTVAAIFQHFEIEILEDKEAKEFGGGFREDCFFVVKWYGIWMKLIPRT